MRLSVLIVAIGIAFASAANGQDAPAPIQAGTVETALSGATFTLPQDWTIEKTPRFVVARPPEADGLIAVVDAPEAKDAPSAAAEAWAIVDPAEHHAVKLVGPPKARNGWDQRQVVLYVTSPNEKILVLAVALRTGQHWTVELVRFGAATAEKRDSGLVLISESLSPAGYMRESFANRTAHPLDAERMEAMRSFVQNSMRQLGIPGASLALIDHGRIVYEGGLGVREIGKPEPVDAHTLFMIASNTKGMSTLLLAELVDQGKLSWDEPVTEAYPAFRLGSAATTAKVRIRDLVCACTGLPTKDLDWIFNTPRNAPAAATFAQLAATEPTTGFGEVYQYNNQMASAAGYIAGHVVYPNREIGRAYDTAMQTMIFNPLGMRDTTFDMARALRGNHASPHGDDPDGRPQAGSMAFNYTAPPYRPAGGAWSSAHDLSQYVLDELKLGELPNGTRLVSAKNLLARREVSVRISEYAYYGMGLEVDSTWGGPVVHHGGSLAGFKSDWIALPDAGVGAVLLTNSNDGWMLLRPFMRRLLEVLYDGKPEAVVDVQTAAARNKAEIAKERARLAIPPAPSAVANLASTYSNANLGHITVSRDSEGVVFDFGAWKSHVASRKNDDGTTSFVTIDPIGGGWEFVVTEQSGKRALIIRDGQHEYLYLAGG